MADLFDRPPIAGLRTREDFLSAGEERALADRILALELSPFRFQGWEGKRLTTSFGWRYDFDDRSFAHAAPIPGWLEPIRARAEEFAGLPPSSFGHALLIRYDPGAAIGWHRDRPHYEEVAGISLLGEEKMRFRRRRPEGGFDRLSLPLPRRSIYLLTGEIRHGWEHSLAPVESLRLSITLRALSAKGRALTGLEARQALGDPAPGDKG